MPVTSPIGPPTCPKCGAATTTGLRARKMAQTTRDRVVLCSDRSCDFKRVTPE